MVAFRVRPRVPRPAIHRTASLGLAGRQTTRGVCTLAAQGGDLQAVGRQRTRGVVNLLTLVGRQATRGLLTPDILCLGRQATHGLCALSGSVSAFANGYGYRALVEIAPQPDLSGTLTNVVIRLTSDVLAATALKTTGNGGKAQSAVGFDIRLEPYGVAVGAGKLDHQFVTAYSGSAGTIDIRFRAPSWDVSTPFRLWLYVGKAGLSATEENPGGLWQGAMRATRLDTGADLSGGTRALTPSGVTAGSTLAGMPAGRFVAASFCRKASPTYVPHLTAATNEIVFQLDAAPGAAASGNLDRIGGTPLSAETHSRYSSFVYQGGKISAGANWYDSASGHQTNEGVETVAGTVGAALVHCMAVRQSGQATVIYVNGASVPVTALNPPATGYINVLANDEDTVGAGQGAQTTSLPGLYALDVQWPAAVSAAFAAVRYRSEIECRSVAGVGAFDAPGDTDQSPVAVPWRTTNAGAQADYDVVPKGFDPDGDPITLASVGASTHAGDATSLTGGKIRYTPQPGWTGGTAEVPFTIADGRGKVSSSRLWLTVGHTVVGSGVLAAWPLRAGLLASGNANRTDVSGSAGLSFAAAAGKQRVVTGNIAAIGNVTITGGTLGQTAYLRGNVDSLNPADWPVISGGTINVSAKSLVICQLQLRNVQIKPLSGCKKLQTECLWFSDLYFPSATAAAAENGCILVDETVDCDGILMAYNQYRGATTECNAAFFRMHGAPASDGRVEAPAHGTNITIYRNHIHKMMPGGNASGNLGNKVMMTGDNDRANSRDINMLVLENLVTEHSNFGNFIENKFGGLTVKNNTLEVGAPTDPNNFRHFDGTLQIRNRHGRKTKDATKAIGVGIGNVATGNLYVWRNGYTRSMEINWRDGYGIITNNWGVTLADGVQPSAGGSPANGRLEVWVQRGNRDWTGYPENEALFAGSAGPSTGKARVAGNRAAIVIGGDREGSSPPAEFDASGNIIANNTPLTRADRNFDIQKDATYPGTNDYATSLASIANYDQAPVRLRRPENGWPGVFDAGPQAYDPSQYGPAA